MIQSLRTPVRIGWLFAGLLAAALWSAAADGVRASSPESADVKAMVQRTCKFLETADAPEVGAKCLQGMALYKAGYPREHPKIQDAIAQARNLAATVSKQGFSDNCYNETIACIFLCEVAPDQCRGEIEAMVKALLDRQTPVGYWGYRSNMASDTSQTQYGMLMLWSAHAVGVTASLPALERATQWLIRTQSSDGGFAYQPTDPGPGKGGTAQNGVTLSMSAAGLGSLYVGMHILGQGARGPRTKEGDKAIPPAVTKLAPETDKKGFQMLTPKTVDVAGLRRACAAGDQWFEKNFKTTNSDTRWTYYYLYGLERYKSFKEIVDGTEDEEPGWYNAVVEYLKTQELSGGGFATPLSGGTSADNAFAVLFLVRSTKKAIKKATKEEGVLVGGKGLPKNLANARLMNGKVVTPQMVKDVDDFLELLKTADAKEFDPTALAGNLSLDEDLAKRTSQLTKLRELVSVPDYRARRAAVKALSRTGELDNVPALIFALSDRDPEVSWEAREGLRFVSRKFEGVGPVSDNPSKEEIEREQGKWKEWFRALRPDAEFLD